MITNAIPAQIAVATDWSAVVQTIAAAVAAVGTVTAISISLWMAWHNRLQFKMTTRLNVLPMLIKETETAATRLERNGIFFPRGGPGGSWPPPTELRALKVALENLKGMEITEDTKVFSYLVKESAMEKVTESETGHDRINTHALLIPVVEHLVQLREEFIFLAEKTRMRQ